LAARGRCRAILGSCARTGLARLAVIMPSRRRAPCGLARARQATTAVEFAICALAMMLIVVGFVEFGRLTWSFEALQEAAVQGARCMGLGASSCSSGGVYSAANTTTYVIGLATSRGVTINAGMVTLSPTATCGGASGFSQVSISYQFTTVAPVLLASLVNGFTVPASACFPNHT
jgi:Flp pilus assembly protein TadG